MIDERALGGLKLKAHRTFLHLGNAHPCLYNDEFEELGIRILLHPPSWPNLAPCDLWLFGYLQQCLKGQSFNNHMALQTEMSKFLMSIEVWTFVRVFTEWKRRLRPWVEQGGDYLSMGRFALLLLKLSGISVKVKGISTLPIRRGTHLPLPQNTLKKHLINTMVFQVRSIHIPTHPHLPACAH
jgi:hypothetical protein